MKMSSKDNPHSVSSILASTPRSKGKKSRKRRLHTDSLAKPQGAVAAAVGKDDSTGTRLGLVSKTVYCLNSVRLLIVYLISSTVSSPRSERYRGRIYT